MRVAVVGHVEWIEFARVEAMPAAGEIVHASEVWEEPGGGGAVAAGQLAKLAGEAAFYTALGGDALGRRAEVELTGLGLTVEAARRPEPQRRGFVHVDAAGERTITVIGERLGPRGEDPLPWSELAGADAVYLTAGDVDAIRAARAAGTLVASARGLEALAEAGVELDALVASATRPRASATSPATSTPNRASSSAPPARPVGAGRAATAAAAAGTPRPCPARSPTPTAAATASPPASPTASAPGMPIAAALQLGARCGAACFTGRGPYAGQLSSADL